MKKFQSKTKRIKSLDYIIGDLFSINGELIKIAKELTLENAALRGLLKNEIKLKAEAEKKRTEKALKEKAEKEKLERDMDEFDKSLRTSKEYNKKPDYNYKKHNPFCTICYPKSRNYYEPPF